MLLQHGTSLAVALLCIGAAIAAPLIIVQLPRLQTPKRLYITQVELLIAIVFVVNLNQLGLISLLVMTIAIAVGFALMTLCDRVVFASAYAHCLPNLEK